MPRSCETVSRILEDTATPIPFDAEQHLFELLLFERIDFARVPCRLFAPEVRLELPCQDEGECIVLCAAW